MSLSNAREIGNIAKEERSITEMITDYPKMLGGRLCTLKH